MNLDLTGKNALVCGGSFSNTTAAAIELSRLGASVTLLARNADALHDTLHSLQHAEGQDHDFIIADTSHHVDLHQKITGLAAQKRIHIVVNNAGGPQAGPLLGADIVAFRQAFDQHLLAYHMIAQILVPGMKEVAWGRIINIISTSVKVPLHGLGVSNTLRAAVGNWSKTLANELAPFHITVNNVLPGATETERLNAIVSNKATRQGKTQEDIRKEMLDEIPMGRFGKPEEIAAAVAFLASPAAGYITGTQITVDGGRTGVL